jgi:hypothetical protein
MAIYPRVPTQNNIQQTLDSQLAAGGTSLTLNASVAGIVQAPGYCWIDRVDSSGSATPTKREYMYFTGVSGAQLTGLTRAIAGSTDQVHSVGAIVEFGANVSDEEDKYSAFTTEHSINGVHASLPSITFAKVSGTLNLSGASVIGLSRASLITLFVTGSVNASGASLAGVLATVPVFVNIGNLSSASAIGSPLDMPQAGTIRYVSALLRGPVSGTSLAFDIYKNGLSIFTVFPGILGGGTFVSTASVATKSFIAGDVFTASKLSHASTAIGNGIDLSLKFFAR